MAVEDEDKKRSTSESIGKLIRSSVFKVVGSIATLTTAMFIALAAKVETCRIGDKIEKTEKKAEVAQATTTEVKQTATEAKQQTSNTDAELQTAYRTLAKEIDKINSERAKDHKDIQFLKRKHSHSTVRRREDPPSADSEPTPTPVTKLPESPAAAVAAEQAKTSSPSPAYLSCPPPPTCPPCPHCATVPATGDLQPR